MAKLSDTFRVINELAADGVITQYAVGGAMAMLFWAEPTVTFDLDVFILLPARAAPIISLEPLYDALRQRGFASVAEHVMIHGMPVQFLVSPNPLGDESIAAAVARELDGVMFRVMRPEYLAGAVAPGGWRQAPRTRRDVASSWGVGGSRTGSAVAQVWRGCVRDAMARTRYARPAPDLVAAQQHGKQVWRRQQAQLSLHEKIRLLLDLQRKLYPVLQQRRTMRPWEIDP